jgi:hypothetical protein
MAGLYRARLEVDLLDVAGKNRALPKNGSSAKVMSWLCAAASCSSVTMV